MDNDLKFKSVPTDADLAASFREDMRKALDVIVNLQNSAEKANMQIGFMLARDQFGRNFVQSINIFKIL